MMRNVGKVVLGLACVVWGVSGFYLFFAGLIKAINSYGKCQNVELCGVNLLPLAGASMAACGAFMILSLFFFIYIKYLK